MIVPFIILISLILEITLVLQIDRYDKEPRKMLIGAWVWGAFPSLFLCILLLKSSDALLVSFIEESVKLLLVTIYFSTYRHQLDNPIDCILYSLLVGLGFNFSETVIYSFLKPDIIITIIRSIFLGFNHGIWTVIAALGLYYAYRYKSFVFAIAGIFLGILLHFIYNYLIFNGVSMSLVLLLCSLQFLIFFFYTLYQMKEETLIINFMQFIPEYKYLTPDKLLRLYRLNIRYKEVNHELHDLINQR